jgi:hypothetical protein
MSILNKSLSQLLAEGVLSQSTIDSIAKKISRAAARAAKQVRRSQTRSAVNNVLCTLLSEPGAAVKHRTVWTAVGTSEFTREEVLNALRDIRDDGELQNIRTSGNNFQIFWARAEEAETPCFKPVAEVVNEVAECSIEHWVEVVK